MKLKNNLKNMGVGLVVSAVAISGAFAYLVATDTATNTNNIKVGSISIKFTDGTSSINIEGNSAIPMSKQSAVETLTPYSFGIENKGNLAVDYTLNVDTNNYTNTFPVNKINVVLARVAEDADENTIKEALLNSPVQKLSAGVKLDAYNNFAGSAKQKYVMIAYIDESANNIDALTKTTTFNLIVNAVQHSTEPITTSLSYEGVTKSQIATSITASGETKNVEVYNIEGSSKDELLFKLNESGLANASDVDALVEVKGEDYDGLNSTATFDVSSVANEGDTVVILHFDETTQEWEYIGTETVAENGTVSGDFSSYSPVAFVVVKKEDITTTLASLIPYIDPNAEYFAVTYTTKEGEKIDSKYDSDWNLIEGQDVPLDNVNRIKVNQCLYSSSEALAYSNLKLNNNSFYPSTWQENTYNESNLLLKRVSYSGTSNGTTDITKTETFTYYDNGEIKEMHLESFSDSKLTYEHTYKYENSLPIYHESTNYDWNDGTVNSKLIRNDFVYVAQIDSSIAKSQKDYMKNWETNELYLSNEMTALNEDTIIFGDEAYFSKIKSQHYNYEGQAADFNIISYEVLNNVLKETSENYDSVGTLMNTEIVYHNYETKVGIGRRAERYDNIGKLLSINENRSDSNGYADVLYYINDTGNTIAYKISQTTYSPEYSQTEFVYDNEGALYNGKINTSDTEFIYCENGVYLYRVTKQFNENGEFVYGDKYDSNYNYLGACDENGNILNGKVLESVNKDVHGNGDGYNTKTYRYYDNGSYLYNITDYYKDENFLYGIKNDEVLMYVDINGNPLTGEVQYSENTYYYFENGVQIMEKQIYQEENRYSITKYNVSTEVSENCSVTEHYNNMTNELTGKEIVYYPENAQINICYIFNYNQETGYTVSGYTRHIYNYDTWTSTIENWDTDRNLISSTTEPMS